jgi:hypothetical protein
MIPARPLERRTDILPVKSGAPRREELAELDHPAGYFRGGAFMIKKGAWLDVKKGGSLRRMGATTG